MTALGDALREAPGRPAGTAAAVSVAAPPRAETPTAPPVTLPPAPPARKKSSAIGVLAGFLLVGALVAGGLWVYRTHFPPGAAGDKAKHISSIPTAPTVVRFTASSDSIVVGSTALLHWQVLDSTDVRIDPQVGPVAAADAIEVKPADSTTYTLTAKGPGGQKTATLVIVVNKPAPEPTKAEKAAKAYQAGIAEEAAHPDKARADFRQAAEWGDARSMVKIGDLLMESGDDAEAAEALRWYHKAGDLGDAGAMLHLGVIYELGDKVQPDYELAAFWYRKASDKGNASATYNLGRMYESGRGVSKDIAKARELYQRAADRGNAEAHIRLSQLSGK